MKLWHIDSSILGDNSVSRELSAAIVARLTQLNLGLEVTSLDLAANPPAHLSAAHIGARFGFAPTDEAVLADIAMGDGYVETLLASDILVIGVPMYNFGLPTQLKAWTDRLLVAGKTFKYNANGIPESLVPAGKKIYLASARGGVYSAGSPAAPLQHQESHLTALLNFIGLTDITTIRAEGVAIPDLKPAAIASAHAAIAALI
jgi:FMN-dependent NADH-azoreductase